MLLSIAGVRPFLARAATQRSIWQSVKPVPPDPILGLVARYKKDPNPNAVNLAQVCRMHAWGG